MTVGDLIKHALETKRISQIELSERTGISTSQISRIVKGERGTSIENLVVLADTLGIKRDLMLRTAAGLPAHQENSDEWVDDMQRKIKLIPSTSRSIAEKMLDALITEPEPLFITYNGREIDPTQIAKSLKVLGEKAGVKGVHPHRFRHTFAIQYLRNSGDPYTLQNLLGHSTLEMVRRYLSLAQVDIDKAHRRASPVDNWGL